MRLNWKKVIATALIFGAPHPSAAQNAQPLFDGEVVYEGTYSGEIKTKPAKVRQLSLGELLRSATSSKTYPLRGTYRIKVEYNGTQIRGRITTTNQAGRNGGSIPNANFVGIRRGNVCDLRWRGGEVRGARCSPQQFSYALNDFKDPRGHRITVNVNANRVSSRTATEIARQKREEAMRTRAAREESVRRQQLARERVSSPPPTRTTPNTSSVGTNNSLNQRLKTILEYDSRRWAFNRLAPDSFSNPRVISGSIESSSFTLRADYTYTSGRKGWVDFKVDERYLACMDYHNTPCNNPRLTGYDRNLLNLSDVLGQSRQTDTAGRSFADLLELPRSQWPGAYRSCMSEVVRGIIAEEKRWELKNYCDNVGSWAHLDKKRPCQSMGRTPYVSSTEIESFDSFTWEMHAQCKARLN